MPEQQPINILEAMIVQECTKPIIIATGFIGLLYPQLMQHVSLVVQSRGQQGEEMNDGIAYDILSTFLDGPARTDDNFRDCWKVITINAIRKALAGEDLIIPTHAGEGHG